MGRSNNLLIPMDKETFKATTPKIPIFTLSVEINGKLRKYNCESQRYIIDEIQLLAYLAKRINKNPPTLLSIKILEIPPNGNMNTSYEVHVKFNNDNGVGEGEYYEIEKILYKILNALFVPHTGKLDIWL